MQENHFEGKDASGGGLTLPLIVHALLLMLGLWGCLAIYNATVYSNAPFYFAVRQFIWLIIGLAAMFLASRIRFTTYMRYGPLIALGMFISLLLVLFFGIRVNGMRGWFAIGSVFVQPSEIAKPFFVLLLCCACFFREEKWKNYLLILVLTFLWIVPIGMQPDYGTVIIYLSAMAFVYLLAGGSYHLLALTAVAAVPGAMWIIAKKPYVLARFVGFLDPSADPSGSGWHILQFQYTLARGGFFGANWGNCLWANSYLPLSYSDSAFAALTEAIGFIGVVPVIFGFALFAYVGYRLASRTDVEVRKIFICAMTSMVTFQAFVHISVNVGLMPPTGITLPMFSYGGSSLVATMLGAGMILSAAKPEEERPPEVLP